MTAQKHIELGQDFSSAEEFVYSGGKVRKSIADRYADIDDKEHEDAVGSLMDKLDQVLNDNNVIAPDLHINDSEIPEMANFFEFCYDPYYGFKTIKPFSRQMWMYSKLFGEICPKCTKKKYQDSILSLPVDAKPSYFSKKITLFRWGVCPKCGLHRSKAFKKGKLNIYQELVQICGQRCVVGNTLVLTHEGLVRIDKYATGMQTGFNSFSMPVHNAKTGMESTSDFYVSKAEHTIKVTTKHGYVIEGTSDHPLYLIDRFKKLKDITTDDYVKIKYNTQVYGNKVTVVEDTRLDEKLAFVFGLWVAEGYKNYISNLDVNLLEYSRNCLSGLVSKNAVTFQKHKGVIKGIRIGGGQKTIDKLYSLGLNTELKSKSKHVPQSILSASKTIQASFLRAYFEGDGTVEKASVTCTSLSKNLIYEIQAMLLNIGIVTRIRKRKTWATNGSEKQVQKNSYELSIQGNKFLEVFEKEIGFFSERKIASLSKLVKSNSERVTDMPYFYDKIPACIKQRLLSFIDSLNYLEVFPSNNADNKIRRKRASLGKSAVLGSKYRVRKDTTNPMFIEDLYKRLTADNVGLSRQRAVKLFFVLDKYCHLFNVEQVHEYAYLKEIILEEDCFFSKVKEVRVSKKPKVTYDFTLPETHQFWSNGFVSHNSGKSIGVSFASTYLLHKMLKLQRPAEFYTGLSNVTLVASFVAMSLSSVMTLLWEPIMDAIENSMWFDEYHELMKYYEKKYGIEIYKKKDTYVRYRHRKIFLQPEVPHKGKLRGKTRWLFSIDEMDHMSEDGDKITVSGTKIWEALDRSCLTMRQSAYDYLRSGKYDTIMPSMALNVSSPASVSGPLFTRFKKNEFSKTVLSIHTPTWEINPKVPRKSEVIMQAYLDDPVMADRDYAAIPPENANPFFTNSGKINACFGILKNKIEYKEIIVRKREKAYIYPEVTGINTAGLSPNGTILALDAGHSNNSFGMAIMQRNQNKIETLAVIEIMPEKNKTTISQGKIIKRLLPLIIKEFDIRGIVADRWQSLATLSVAEEENPSLLFTEVYSLKYIDFIAMRSYVQDEGLMVFPKLELSEEDCIIPKSDYPEVFRGKPVSHLRNQFSTVVDKMKTVDKGDNRTDDVFRAVALGFRFLLNEKYDKYFKPRKQSHRAVVGLTGTQSSGGGVNVAVIKGRAIGASM